MMTIIKDYCYLCKHKPSHFLYILTDITMNDKIDNDILDNNITDDDFILDFGDEERTRWNDFLYEIDKGNVIPVIGPDLLTEPKLIDPSNGRVENFHQQLISFIARQSKVKSKPRTFSQLVYDEDYIHAVNNNEKQIYKLINQVLSNLDHIKFINSQPSQLLMDLLGTRKFPFVITTSFTPIVENVMKKIWGDVKVLNFTNNPSDSDPEHYGDISSENDLKRPSVYYMFGKYSDSHEKYVLTDSDMMVFCSSWIKGHGVPTNLTAALKKKYLLILGNNYSDWLFRFVWFALRTNTAEMKSDYVVNDTAEDALKQFIERLETFFQENPAEVIQRIKENMELRSKDKAPTKVYKHDVFISYSRTDIEVATNLYNALKDAGLNVWFDNKSIEKGADWEKSMTRGVKESRLFIPILTSNVEKESVEVHQYRSEWNIASELASIMGRRAFIIPFAENGFNFYNELTGLPKQFTKVNATWYSNVNDVAEITQVVVKEIASLKEIENRLKRNPV